MMPENPGINLNGYKTLPWIDIDPWLPQFCGPNSLDVHLGDKLLAYDYSGAIDPECPPKTFEIEPWPEHDGRVSWMLHPKTLYFGSTVERIECHGVVPWIDGRSSMGRLGVSVHITAGRGDDGFSGNFTFEITVVHPIILRPGMRIAQLTFMETKGERRPYQGRYKGPTATGPVASRFGEG